MHQNSHNRQNLQQPGQGPVVGHTQEGVLSPVPPWTRLVPAPVAVDQQAALPRTSISGNGFPHTPVMVTLVVVMPAVVMSAEAPDRVMPSAAVKVTLPVTAVTAPCRLIEPADVPAPAV